MTQRAETGPLRHPLLEACGVEHGFGVRGAPAPPDVRRPAQVHGVAVVTAEACAAAEPPEADAVVSRLPGVRVGVITADCLPLLVAARDGRAVAAIHAGWRGLAAGVVAAGVAALQQYAGEVGLRVAVGPHVGPCCYEVDAPVWEALGSRFGDALSEALRPSRPGHAWLDLGRLVREELGRIGIAPEDTGLLADSCTACNADRFHSYRRDGAAAGRLLHFIRASPMEA